VHASSVQFRVRYAETDAQGIVHHSNYLIWFESGRTELLRGVGLPYVELERQGYLIVVVRADLKYHRPAHYDDQIRLETQLVRARGKVVEFCYRVFNQADELLVTGTTTHMLLGADRRPARLPVELLRRLSPAANNPVDTAGAS